MTDNVAVTAAGAWPSDLAWRSGRNGVPKLLVDCNSGCVSTDAMLHVAVRPDKWLASRVVRPDVLQELAPQVRDGGEDPARKEIPLDLRKPELDLVEPRGVGRRVVDGDARMRCQPDLHALRLVGREVVANEVNLP